MKIFTGTLLLLLAGLTPLRAAGDPPALAAGVPGKKTVVYVIPVRTEIAKPVLYIIRRGLKEAIVQQADVVVLDMNTPGGALDVTFDIMEALEKFPGKKLTYVNREALSAGAFISAVTDEIYFAPRGVIGAAAPVSSTGQDIDATMKQKVVSYLKARVRAISEGKGYRGEVISSMIDADYELKIGDKVIKPKGELLSLTATEASQTYGDPPRALLAAGIAKDLDTLLRQQYGKDGFVVRQFEITWSESLATWLNAVAPILLGLGLLGIYLEFKAGGHGLFAAIGAGLLAVVFFGHFVAGLSGHEPAVVFMLGLLLVIVEIFFFPGVALPALLGLALMLGSLVWAMADLWPNEPLAFSGDIFVRPVANLSLGILIAAGLALALLKYLPEGWVWHKLIVGATVGTAAQTAGLAPEVAAQLGSLIGLTAVAVTALRPSGQVEIAGRRYEAKVEVGVIDPGTAVIVRGRTDFALLVEKADA